MITWTTQIALHVMLMTGTTPTYAQAVKLAQKQNKPLVVFVGANWCPGCQTMKHEKLPEIKRKGIFKNVVFTMVNTDQQPELTQRLLTTNSIPQLVLFVKGPRGWHRAVLIGVNEPESVRQFLAHETAIARSTGQLAETKGKTGQAATGQTLATQ